MVKVILKELIVVVKRGFPLNSGNWFNHFSRELQETVFKDVDPEVKLKNWKCFVFQLMDRLPIGWKCGWSSSTQGTKQSNSSRFLKLSFWKMKDKYNLFYLWMNLCLIRLIFKEKDLMQLSHLNSFSFFSAGFLKWLFMCLFSMRSIENSFLQFSHWNGLWAGWTDSKWFLR